MKLEAIKAVADKYLNKLRELEKSLIQRHGRMKHFKHVTHNNTLAGDIDLIENYQDHGFTWERIRPRFVSNLRNLRRYLRLIEKFPDFAKKEATESLGYFPDIAREVVDGNLYVERAYDKLIKEPLNKEKT